MKFIRGIHNLQSNHRQCSITIGNFDGFHRGHQILINTLLKESKLRKLPVTVIIFEPYPKEFFLNISYPIRLTRLRDKIQYLFNAGVENILCITFNRKFSKLNSYMFITEILVKKLNIKLIIVGDDFHFGSDRFSNFSELEKIGKKVGFDAINIRTHKEKNIRVSSTAIREALFRNKLQTAEVLLGHSYEISGRVVYGKAIGRKIGFPTANLLLKDIRIPINGVYAVEVYDIKKEYFLGVANIGICNTIQGLKQKIEVHLLDIKNINLYGHYIKINIKNKIREEKKFSSLYELQQQIVHDIINVRNFFNLKKKILQKSLRLLDDKRL